jgi:hypothetical protein
VSVLGDSVIGVLKEDFPVCDDKLYQINATVLRIVDLHF